MIEPAIAIANLADDATLAEGLLKFTLETLLKKRPDDLAFFDERIEKGLRAKLEGIVGERACPWITARRSRCSSARRTSFEFPVCPGRLGPRARG
jgi:asparaginyl-tRNA synthetase